MSCPPAVTRPRGPFSELVRKVRGDLRQPGFLLSSVGGCVTPGSPKVPHLGASVCAGWRGAGERLALSVANDGREQWPQREGVRSPGGAGLLSGVTGQEPAGERALQNLLGSSVGVESSCHRTPGLGERLQQLRQMRSVGPQDAPPCRWPAPSSARGSLSVRHALGWAVTLFPTGMRGLLSGSRRGPWSPAHGRGSANLRLGLARALLRPESLGDVCVTKHLGSAQGWSRRRGPSEPRASVSHAGPCSRAQPPRTHQSGR